MFVQNASSGRLQRCRDRASGIGNIFVVEAGKSLRFVAGYHTVEEKEELMLPLRQLADRGKHHGDVAFLLFFHNGGWMLARRGEIGAVGGARNLDQALGSTADGADTPAEGRTLPPSLPRTTRGADHEASFAHLCGRSNALVHAENVRGRLRRYFIKMPVFLHSTLPDLIPTRVWTVGPKFLHGYTTDL
jgi:hypothetical protein